jgi:hypothetical protein
MRYLWVIILLINLLVPRLSFAQQSGNPVRGNVDSLGIASYVPISDDKVTDGDLISFGPKGYFRTDQSYDQNVIGVVTSSPAVAITSGSDDGKTYAVVPQGNAYVHVSTGGGPIKKGDLLTSSENPGVAIKAIRSGFVVGNALEDFSASDPKTVAKIAVNLNVHYFYNTKEGLQRALSDMLNLSALALTEQPSVMFRYIAAAIVMITSIAAAFFTFARIAKNGIEALGRNPLAGKLIQIGIIINVVICIAIILTGAAIAYLIIRL